jgi:hypothetical protein
MASLCTQIAKHLISMNGTERAEYFALILEFLRRQTGKPVESLHDFITATPTEELPETRRDELLAIVARALKERDQFALQSNA